MKKLLNSYFSFLVKTMVRKPDTLYAFIGVMFIASMFTALMDTVPTIWRIVACIVTPVVLLNLFLSVMYFIARPKVKKIFYFTLITVFVFGAVYCLSEGSMINADLHDIARWEAMGLSKFTLYQDYEFYHWLGLDGLSLIHTLGWLHLLPVAPLVFVAVKIGQLTYK